jgi:hypothetical protein
MAQQYSGADHICFSSMVSIRVLGTAKGYVKPASGAACHNVFSVFSVLLG